MTERESRIQTVCLTILAAVALGWVLHWSRPVMLPFTVAVMTVLGLSTIVDILVDRAGLPRRLAVICALIVGVAGLSLVGFLISVSVASLVQNASLYQSQFRVVLENAIDSLPLARFGLDPETITEQIPLNAVGSILVGTGNALLEVLSQGLMVLVFVIFLLAGLTSARRTGGMWAVISSRVRRYIATKVAISAITGLATGLILTLLGIPLAIAFGLMAFLLNFIPSVGSIVAVLLPLPILLVDPRVSTTAAVLALVLPGAVQLTLGNVLEPKIMGRSMELHPAVVLMSLVLWGMLWGVVGMFVAVPLTATFKIVLERMEHTRPIADLLGGDPRALLED
jgi:AI-2 transport protein TqsA